MPNLFGFDVSRITGLKVFDWNKAAQIIMEAPAGSAEAWITGDKSATRGPIFEHGKPYMGRYKACLASRMGTPVLRLDDEPMECWMDLKDIPREWVYPKMDSPLEIWWPNSALRILTIPAPTPGRWGEGAPGSDTYFSFAD